MKKMTLAICIYICFSGGFAFAETLKVLVTSTSTQKNAAVASAFKKKFPQNVVEIIPYPSKSRIPSEPIGYEVALKGARNRIDDLPEELLSQSQYVVSIENFIEPFSDSWGDVGLVILNDLSSPKEETIALTRRTWIPSQYVEMAKNESVHLDNEGFSTTVGKSIQKSFTEYSIDPQDWHKEKAFGGVSRKDLLEEALFKALYKDEILLLKGKIQAYPDFPKPGILFEDFFPILHHNEAFQHCINLLHEWVKDKNIEMIVGLESRGFILGAALACKLGIGFTPVRKPGKLPGLNHSITYQKEYGTDTLVISQSALQINQRVLIVDDLIATGGSAQAAMKLVKLAGADPVEFVSLLEVKNLMGRISLGIPSFNLID